MISQKEKIIKIFLNITIFTIFLTTILNTNIANANNESTMLSGEKYEDSWIRPSSCIHEKTLIRERIDGRFYGEVTRAFLNNIQRDDILGKGKPIQQLIHYNLDDPDKYLLGNVLSTLTNLALKNNIEKNGKAVGIYGDGTINTKYGHNIGTISYKGNEGNPKWVYGPSTIPNEYPQVPWNPAKYIEVISPKKQLTEEIKYAKNLQDMLPEATLSPTMPKNTLFPPSEDGTVVINLQNAENIDNVFNIQKLPKGTDVLSINYALYYKAPYLLNNNLKEYVQKYKSQIKKIIIPANISDDQKNKLADYLDIPSSTIVIPTPYTNPSLKTISVPDATVEILKDVYANNIAKNTTIDTLIVSKSPYFYDLQGETLSWETDFATALALIVNKPSKYQAIGFVNPKLDTPKGQPAITPKFAKLVEQLAPGNIFISGGKLVIKKPDTEKTLSALSRKEKHTWLDTYSENCRHDNPKLEIAQKRININNDKNEKIDIKEKIKYQILIKNNAESGIAKNVQIIDNPIDGLQLTQYELEGKTTNIYNNMPAKIKIDKINPNETKIINIEGITNRSKENETTNMAYIYDKTVNPIQQCNENNKCTKVTTNQKRPKLIINKTVENIPENIVNVGQEIKYKLTVTNSGDGKTDDEVKIVDTPQEGITLLDSNTHNIGILYPNETKTIYIRAKITNSPNKQSINTANACFGKNCTKNPNTNDTNYTTHILKHNSPVLTITKTHDKNKNLKTNDYSEFYIKITNPSNAPAFNTTVEDFGGKNISQLEYVKIPTGTIENNKWKIPQILPKESFTATLKAKILNETEFENKACLKADYINQLCVTNSHNDESHIKVTSELIPDDKIEEATYKITVTNTGSTESRILTLKNNTNTINSDTEKTTPFTGKYEFIQVDKGNIYNDKNTWQIGKINPDEKVTALVKISSSPENISPKSKIINTTFPIDHPNCETEKYAQECVKTEIGGVKITKTIDENNKNIQSTQNGKIKFNINIENTTQSPVYNTKVIDVGGINIKNIHFISKQMGRIENNEWIIPEIPPGKKIQATVEAIPEQETFINQKPIENTAYVSSKLFYSKSFANIFNINAQKEKNLSFSSNTNNCTENEPYCSKVELKDNSNIKIHKTLIAEGIKTYDGKYTWNMQIGNFGNMPAKNIKAYEILTPQIKDVNWLDNPNINILNPGEIKNIKVQTTIANPNIGDKTIKNTAIVEADNYKPIFEKTQNTINEDNNTITPKDNNNAHICEDNSTINEDNDRCDIAIENTREQTGNLPETGTNESIIFIMIILSIIGIITRTVYLKYIK